MSDKLSSEFFCLSFCIFLMHACLKCLHFAAISAINIALLFRYLGSACVCSPSVCLLHLHWSHCSSFHSVPPQNSRGQSRSGRTASPSKCSFFSLSTSTVRLSTLPFFWGGKLVDQSMRWCAIDTVSHIHNREFGKSNYVSVACQPIKTNNMKKYKDIYEENNLDKILLEKTMNQMSCSFSMDSLCNK